MNKIEAQILHGIYHHREMVGEDMPFTASEINWLINSCIPITKNWQDKNGKLKTLEEKNEDYLASIGATSAAAIRPLSYLQEAGYINYKKDHNYIRISVTGKGADVARELDTKLGRANLFYKNHKNGLLWFMATILVSIITTLITNSGK